MDIKEILCYLPFQPKFYLPLESERFDNITEGDYWRLSMCFSDAIDVKLKDVEKYKTMYFFQEKPSITWDDNELFLGQMRSSLGWEEDDVYLKELKILLHPLSDLDKYCEDLGFVPIKELEKIRNGLQIYKPLTLSFNFPIEINIETEDYSQNIDLFDGYLITQKLYEWNFDLTNLIERGLAKDIKEIKTSLQSN